MSDYILDREKELIDELMSEKFSLKTILKAVELAALVG